MFRPSRLELARKLRGLNKVSLSRVSGVPTRSLTAYESGAVHPGDEAVGALARALAFPPAFFASPSAQPEIPTPDAASFRALTSATASKRDAALASGALAIELDQWLSERFSSPASDLPDLRGLDPEVAAYELRARWALGETSISNVVHMLERRGVRVFSLVPACREIDAFSLWREGTPYVFVNTTTKSAERGRFDAAHELGHLVLHRHGHARGREAEEQADRFASAMLMPKGSLLASGLRRASLEELVVAKRAWGVSVGALVHRLYAVGMMTEWDYRSRFIDIGRRGYRTCEPNPIARETSQRLQKILAGLRAAGVGRSQIAAALSVCPADVDALMFGLVMTGVEGSNTPSPSRGPRPTLRLA